MASLAKNLYTPEQYLEIERAADFKSEYIAGEMVAMAGVSRRHSLINSNIAGQLLTQLKGKGCETHIGDLRVHVGASFFYPDVAVVCGDAKLRDDTYLDTLLNPTVIVEVLSKSTESYDRSIKFLRYAQIESLTDYILVSQESPKIEQFSRLPNGEWGILATVTDPDAVVEIASIGGTLRMADVYAQVSFG